MGREEDVLRAELLLLRVTLDELEKKQRAEAESLRGKIEALEERVGRKAVVEIAEMVELPKPVALSEWMEEVKEEPVISPEPVQKVAPPPLPKPEPVAAQVVVPKDDDGFEMRFGRVWLVRFGIVLLVTGLALLGNYAYRNWIRDMPPGVRLLGLFICSGLLVEAGRRLAARESMRRPGEVILAGGLAFFYYCTFAAHHVQRLRVIESPVVAAVLLFGAAALIAFASWKRGSRVMAVMGILLASYSTMLQPVGWLSCVSSTLLAGAGVFLMSRPGWGGPGLAAMAATYGAFFGWQMMGASGGSAKEPALMWFLPPVWAMFSLPAVMDRFRESMGDRAKAWFTGGNNAVFFILFSLLWAMRYETEGYWMVPVVFGVVLIGLGVWGRNRSNPAGGVNVCQGIGLASLGLVIKLEGYHLSLALAAESLVLAGAFRKFRGKSELVFSLLAALGAVLLTLNGRITEFSGWGEIPLWSSGLVAVLLAAASLVLKADGDDEKGGGVPALLFVLSLVAASVGWAWWLPQPWPVVALAGIALVVAVGTVILPKKWEVSEFPVCAVIVAFIAAIAGMNSGEPWAVTLAGCFALAAVFAWKRAVVSGKIGEHVADTAGWMFSVLAAGAFWWAIVKAGLPVDVKPLLAAVAALLVGGAAVFAGSGALFVSSGVLLAASLAPPLWSWQVAWVNACVVPLALVHVALAVHPRSAGRLDETHRWAGGGCSRLAAFAAVCLFWNAWRPEHFGDGVGLTAIVLAGALMFFRKALLPEVWGFVVVGAVWLVARMIADWPWRDEPSWRGGFVALSALAMIGVAALKRGKMAPELLGAIVWLAVGVISMWSTEMLVWRHGWHGAAVLWTLLGFAVVCGGLVSRIAALRQAGLALLGIALVKVFAVDVWDFNAFMRVVAFLVLGAALVLLGLFYNRFAIVLKKLIEEEPAKEEVADKET